MRYTNTRRIREFSILISTCIMLLWHTTGAQNVYTLTKFDSTISYPCATGGVALSDASFHGIYALAFNDTGSLLILDALCSTLSVVSTSGIVNIIAGTGTQGYNGDSISAIWAELNQPADVAYCSNNKSIYIADAINYCVRKVDSNGVITTVAGTPGVRGYGGDGGPATAALFNTAAGIAIDKYGELFISDNENKRVRKVDTLGIITTFAGTGIDGHIGDRGPATAAQFYNPTCIRMDKWGDFYVGDSSIYVQKIDTSGIITTVAGNGFEVTTGDGDPATNASINMSGLCIDTAGDLIIANDWTIRKVSASGIITTIAGNGTGGFAGDGGPAMAAEFEHIYYPVFASNGDIYVPDNTRLRIITSKPMGVPLIADLPKVDISPNPCEDHFDIHIGSTYPANCEVVVTDMLGRALERRSIAANATTTIYFHPSPGCYFVTVSDMAGSVTQKLFVR